MHPASSIIAFTTLSGLGFGLMTWLGLGGAPIGTVQAFFLSALSVTLAGAGLLASLLHLGQPRRFLKAFTQWRSSWLSREAVLAMATFGLFGLFAAAWVFLGVRARWLGIPAAALAGGALLSGETGPVPAWLLAALGLVQIAAWARGDGSLARSGTTLATATGLGALGRLRLLAPPHTGANYLMREMVHVIGRRHAVKLRVIGLLLAVAVPLGLVLAGLPLAAAPLHVLGMLVLRWLFFAEAEHVVGLYYGKG